MNKALLIGIDEYATQPSLAGCINDVLDAEQLLRNRNAVAARDIVILADRQATKIAIVKALSDLVGGLHPGDRGYVHFSGHGVRMPSMDVDDPDAMDEVLCPHDFEWTPETAITDAELLEILGKLERSARMIISIDSCHSGDFLRGLGLRGRARTLTTPPGFRTRGPTLHGFRTAARAPNITFVSACSPWQTAADARFDGRANGAFSYYFFRELAANSAPLEDAIAAIDNPLRDYGMMPVAENAALCYLPRRVTFASPLRLAMPSRASVFEQHWQTSLIAQPIAISVRITTVNGELAAFLGARGFGNTMTSPRLRVSGNQCFPIQLGFFGAQIILTILDWAERRDAIDFTLQLELANDLPFVPPTPIALVPVHVDVAQLARTTLSSLDLVELFR